MSSSFDVISIPSSTSFPFVPPITAQLLLEGPLPFLMKNTSEPPLFAVIDQPLCARVPSKIPPKYKAPVESMLMYSTDTTWDGIP